MNSKKQQTADYLDLLFEFRNKMYGAYQLRKSYVSHVRKGLLITNTLAILLSLIVLYPKKPHAHGNETLGKIRPKELKPLGKLPKTEPNKTQIKSIKTTKPSNPIIEVVKDIPETKPDVAASQQSTPNFDGGSNGTDNLTSGTGAGGGGNDTAGSTINFSPVTSETNTVLPTTPTNTIVAEPDEEAMYPGGFKKMRDYLEGELKHPGIVVDGTSEVVVEVEFEIDEFGKLSHIEVVNKVHPEYDKEAKRVISLMPPWKPARYKGKPIKSNYKMNVVFNYSDDNPTP